MVTYDYTYGFCSKCMSRYVCLPGQKSTDDRYVQETNCNDSKWISKKEFEREFLK